MRLCSRYSDIGDRVRQEPLSMTRRILADAGIHQVHGPNFDDRVKYLKVGLLMQVKIQMTGM